MRIPSTLALAFITVNSLAQGDLCTNAQFILPGTYTADGPFTGNGASQPDATHADWYSFDPDFPGYITATSCGDGIRDTRVWVHTGSCGGFLTTLDSDDDGCPTGYPPGNSLLANVPVTPGNLYFIEWDDRWSGQGFTWDLLFHTCPIALPTLTSTDTSISVDWSEGSPGDQFLIEVGPSGFTPGNGIQSAGVLGSTTLPVVIGGLSPGIDHEVYLTINCAGGSSSPFSGPWPVATTGTPIVLNDACTGALPIACGDTLQGSTEYAQADTVSTCGTAVSAPGVWYTFSGQAGAVVLGTCAGADHDTKLNVYSGSCGNLSCVTGNDDACALLSEVSFLADADSTYFILVQGYNGSVGNFNLSMQCPTCAPPLNIAVQATNDEADVYWTSANTSATFTVEYGPAGFTPGTGTVLTGTVGTDGPPVNIPGLSAAMDYDLYVSEDCGGGDVSPLAGPVGFTTLAQPLAVNALCSDALPITCGDAVNGSTVNGLLATAPTCAGANITAPGVWYRFSGNGDDVTLATCGLASFDSKISVFTGSCAALVCAGGNDDGVGCSGNTSTVTIPTQNGTDYLVLVHGYLTNTGTFTLTMTCAPPCAPLAANDDCANAELFDPQAIGNCAPLTGDNTCAYASAVPNPPCDPFATIQDVWYQFNTGPDGDHTITVEPVSATSVSAALYTQCASFVYVDCAVDLVAPVVFTGLALNTTYYLRVWNAGGLEAGTFTVCDEAVLVTDIADVVGTGLRVMPVPTRDLLTVEGLAADVRDLTVFDLQGRAVRQVAANGATRLTLDVSALNAGTYVLRANGDVPRVVRFMVE